MKQFFAVISFFLLYAVNSFSRNSVDTIPFRTTVSNPQTLYQAWNLGAINSFLPPIKDTLNHPATPYPGALTIRPQDVAVGRPIVYMTNGTRWDALIAVTQGSVADTLFVADDLYVTFDEEGRQILRRRRSEAIVTTVAGLRALDTAYTNILYETIDYGGGLWNFKRDSMNADNTGLFIKLASQDTGRMVRMYSGKKDARWFGAVADGVFTAPNTVTGTDNQLALQAWLNTGGALYLPGGIFGHTDRLEINQEETEIEGDGENLSQLLYMGSDFDDQLIIADSTHNRGIKLKKIRLTGGGRARYNFWSYTFNRSCEITDCKFRDALGVIKIEHGYYSNIDRNLFGPTISNPMAAGITRSQWLQVWQSGGAYTAPIHFGEMNGSSISGNKIAEVQTRPYGDTTVPAQTFYLYGEAVEFNANLFEQMSYDTTHQSLVMLRIANNSSINISGIYFEVVGSDYMIYSDAKSFVDIKGLQAYLVRGNTMFYGHSFGKFKVSNSTGHRLKFQRLRESVNFYDSEQDIVFDRCQFLQGDRLTDSTLTPYSYNLFDTYGTGWPYGMTDGSSAYSDLNKKRFIKVISGYDVTYGTDSVGAYVMIDCGQAILEDGSQVSLNFYVDGNDLTTEQKIKMKLRPDVVSKFYRLHINRAGGLFLIENSSAFTHAKGDWIASFETNGAGAIINTAVNPRLTQNGAYLQNSDLIYATGIGSPEGVVAALPGSFYTSTSDGKLYVKVSGTATSTTLWDQTAFLSGVTSKVDSVKKRTGTDTVDYYINGIAYFGFVDAQSAGTTTIASNVTVSADNSWDIGNSTNALKNVYSYNFTSKGTIRFQTSLSTSPMIWTQNVTDVARLYGTTGNFVISPQGSPADVSSAALQVLSTTKGFLLPRLTTAQRDAVSSPVAGLHIYNTTTNKNNYHNGTAWTEVADAGGGGGAWGSITGTLSDQTDLQTELNLKAPLISPSFTTPSLGVAAATTINKVTFTTPATGSTLTIAEGKTLTASNTLTLAGTDGSTLNIGTGGTLGTNAYTSTAYLPLAGGTLTGQVIQSTAGALSVPALTGTGTWITGGSATTTKPYFLIEPTGATSTAWSTAGTGLGVNAASGFTGNLIDVQLNGATKFRVSSAGDTYAIGAITSNAGYYLSGSLALTAAGAELRFNDNSAYSTVQLKGRLGLGLAAATALLHIKAGTATASTAPLKFTSGTLLTTAEAGSVEFLTDKYYGTITTGAARKTFAFLEGTATNDDATAGNIGEEVNAIVSTYTNYTTTATYQNITSITLTAGDWDLSAFMTYSSNAATITAASNAIFVISTTTASAAGATEGKNILYVPQAALLGTSLFSESISPYRVSISGSTTYYLNTQATFTLGNPQYVGSIRGRRIR